MAKAVKITFRNKDKMLRRMQATIPGVRAGVNEAMESGAKDIVETATRLAPKRSGDYADTIQEQPVTEFTQGDRLFKGVRAWGIFAHWTWKAIEFGTKSHPNLGVFKGTMHPGTRGQPHLFPAYRLGIKSVQRKIASAISKAIKKQGG